MSGNKELVTSYLHALSGNPKPPGLVAQYVSDPALAQHIAEIEAAFPSYEITPEQMIAENDLVAVRAAFRGVHRGVFAGLEPTGKTVSAGLIVIYRVQNNRIVQNWMQFDLLSLLGQLNAPAPVS